jgi:divalent metal cation (Fe/Co/Zn/Cd) transporter
LTHADGGDRVPATLDAADRRTLVRRGLWLVAASITWMVVEGVVSLGAAVTAGSVALLAFGVDSFIELGSDCVVAWRLVAEARGAPAADLERVERLGARLAGGILLLLAFYVVWEAGGGLLGRGERAGESFIGMVITAAALVIMPLLAHAKLRVAAALDSRTLRTDAYEAVCCAWLSATTLAGLALNAAFGWWWADPLAALAIVPLLTREGLAGWRARPCACGP